MTIIIAGICGEKVVMLGDRTDMLEEELHEQEGPKIYCINNRICVGFAGTAGYEGYFLEDITDKTSIKESFELLKGRYSNVRTKLVKERFLSKYGVESIEELKSILNDCELLSYHLEEIESFDPDIKILIGGIDSSPHIFAIGNPGTGVCFDESGFYAIGSGEKEATMMLNFLNYRKTLPLKTCIFYLYLAKKAAEKAVGVGEKTDIFVISREGVEMVDKKEYLIKFKSMMEEIERIGSEKK